MYKLGEYRRDEKNIKIDFVIQKKYVWNRKRQMEYHFRSTKQIVWRIWNRWI